MTNDVTSRLEHREHVPLEASYSALPVSAEVDTTSTNLIPYITVEDDEIEATEVTLVPTKAEQDKRKRNKMKIYGAIVVLGVVILVTVIMVPIFTILEGRKEDSNLEQTSSPTLEPTLSPTHSQLYLNYVDFFSNISNRTLLITRGTPQYKALQWIYKNDPAGRRPLSHPRLNQRYISAVFYYSTSLGMGWSDCYPGDVLCNSDSKSAWFGSDDECNWYGFAECNSNGFVQKFVMLNNQNMEERSQNGNGLHGFLPSEFGYLEYLKDLTIARNNLLKSTIPSTFSKLSNLRVWIFNDNELEGPLNQQIFKNMTNLQVLHFNDNNFHSEIPVSLGNARSLSHLELKGNSFAGEVPTQIGLLSSLSSLRLNNNKLSGTISNNVFADMPYLSQLDLSNNMLGGYIPENLGYIGRSTKDEKDINLSKNFFIGSIPSNLANIPKLHELLLQNNSLSGNLPEEMCDETHADSSVVSIIKVDCGLVECKCCAPSCDSNG